MIAEMREALQELLGREVSEPVLLAGGASKEAWSVDADGEKLLVRRAAVGVIHKHTLSLQAEFAVLEAAYEADVKVPRPMTYIPDLAGREAFVMERLDGETIGRRIVRKEELEHARFLLPVQMAEELAKIHGIARERVPFLEESRLERMIEELDEVGEPRPAIELGLSWLRENRPAPGGGGKPLRRRASRSSCTATSASAISSSTRTDCGASSTGSSRTSTTPSVISRSRSCGRGGSACRRSGSAASAASGRTSRRTTRSPGTMCRTKSSSTGSSRATWGGRSAGSRRWGGISPVRTEAASLRRSAPSAPRSSTRSCTCSRGSKPDGAAD